MKTREVAVERKLHPNVELAPGLELTEWHWEKWGELLAEGISGHRIRITKLHSEGLMKHSVELQMCPLDKPWPVRFQES